MLYLASRITDINASTTFLFSFRSGVRNMFFTSCCVSVDVPRTAEPRVAPWSTAPTRRRNEMPPCVKKSRSSVVRIASRTTGGT